MKRESKTEEKGKVFDFSTTIDRIKGSLKKDDRRKGQFGLGSSLTQISQDPKDYVVMPSWWKEYFGVMGLQFGKVYQIAGDSDTGKTSLALEAILRAQQQGYGIVYVETEGKTSEADLISKGIDPKGVMVVSSAITEEAFDNALKCWDEFFKDFPNSKLLLVYDSYGNTVSMRDAALDMTKDFQKPGGAAKTNRLGLNTMIARMMTDPVCVFIVNYVYSNIGGRGGTVNAGGKALNFFSMLTLQSTRLGWLDVVRNGVRVREGAKVRWRVYKNHYAKTLVDEKGEQILLPAFIDLKITTKGLEVVDAKFGVSEEEED